MNLRYEWQDEFGTTISNLSTATATTVGTYTLIVTNEDNGCSASSTVDVIPDTNLPTVEAGTGGILDCETTILTLNGTGSSAGPDFEYEWQNAAGTIVSTDLIFETTAPDVYTLIVLNTANNCTAQDQVTITQDINDPNAFADYGSAQSLDCNNTSITLDGSGSAPFGNLNFAWSTSDGNISTGANTINPEIDLPGTYTLIVTNTLNGCTNTTTINVDQDITPPSVLINEPDVLTCITDAVTLDATLSSANGDFSYSWTGNGLLSGATSLEPTVEQSGNFTLG